MNPTYHQARSARTVSSRASENFGGVTIFPHEGREIVAGTGIRIELNSESKTKWSQKQKRP